MGIVSRGDSSRSLGFECHLLRKCNVCIRVGEVIGAVGCNMIHVEFPTFFATGVLIQ